MRLGATKNSTDAWYSRRVISTKTRAKITDNLRDTSVIGRVMLGVEGKSRYESRGTMWLSFLERSLPYLFPRDYGIP